MVQHVQVLYILQCQGSTLIALVISSFPPWNDFCRSMCESNSPMWRTGDEVELIAIKICKHTIQIYLYMCSKHEGKWNQCFKKVNTEDKTTHWLKVFWYSSIAEIKIESIFKNKNHENIVVGQPEIDSGNLGLTIRLSKWQGQILTSIKPCNVGTYVQV
jgi:hypothetical protein